MQAIAERAVGVLSVFVLAICTASPLPAQTYSSWSTPVSLTSVNSNVFDG